MSVSHACVKENALPTAPTTAFFLAAEVQCYTGASPLERVPSEWPELVDDRSKLYVLVGVPGSGKSTYARSQLAHALRVSLDDLRLMLTGRTFDARIEPTVAVAGRALLEALAGDAAARKYDLVFDATNVTLELRAPLVRLARTHGLSPVAVYLRCELAIAQARNRARQVPVPSTIVSQFDQRLVPPTIEEGFDEILTYDATGDQKISPTFDAS